VPTGSEVQFNLESTKGGSFNVSAKVDVFSKSDCSDTPQPNYGADLTVTVEVNNKERIMTKIAQLGTILWDQFLNFWQAFVALFFGLILFLIRGNLKKRFGFDSEQKP
jgi:hypothetical protein